MIEVLGPVNRELPHTIITIRKQPTILPWLRKVPLAIGQYVVNGNVRMYLADRLGKRLAAAGVLHAEYVDPKAELTAAINSRAKPKVDQQLMGFIQSKLEQHEQVQQAMLGLLLTPVAESVPESSVVQVDSQLSPVTADDDFTRELSPHAAELMRAAEPPSEPTLVDQLETPAIVTPPAVVVAAADALVEAEIPPVSAEQMEAAVIVPKKRKRRTAAEMEAARAAEALLEAAPPVAEAIAPASMDILETETPGST